MAARAEERFRHYRAARLAYEAYVTEHHVRFDKLTWAEARLAANDPRLREAEAEYKEAIALTSRSEHARDAAVALSQLGMLLHLVGRLAEARQAFHESIGILDGMVSSRADEMRAKSTCQYHLGLINIKEGHFADARKRLAASARIDHSLGDSIQELLVQEAINGCPAGEGTPEPAVAVSASAAGATAQRADPEPDYLAGENEELELPGIFSESTREAIWILAASEASVRVLEKTAKQACPQNRELVLYLVACDMGAASPPAMEPGTRLCAALFEISPAALRNADFRYWLRWSIQRAVDAADFRLLIYLNGIEEAAFLNLAARDPLIAELRDKVQLHRPDRIEVLGANLRSHLVRLEVTRDMERGQRLRWVSRRVAGAGAAVLQSAFILFWLGAAVWALWAGEPAVAAVAGRFPHGAEWFGFLAAIPLAWCALIALAIARQGWQRGSQALVSPGRSVGLLLFTLVVARAAGWFPRILHSPAHTLVAGVLVGLLLDGARRRGATAARASLLRTGQRMVEAKAVPVDLLTPGRANPAACPYFATGSKVFVSYSRSSEWGSRCAVELHSRLLSVGLDSFMDRFSIPPGTSWQRRLDEQIGAADVFIALCDAHTIQRPWVGAELAAALAGRRLSGAPQVLLVHPGTISDREVAAALPVFREAMLAAEREDAGAPVLIEARESDSMALVVAAVDSSRMGQTAIFPSWVHGFVMALAFPVMVAIGLSPLLGIPALLVGVGMKLGKIDINAWLRSWLVWWLAMLLPAMIGTTMRQAIAERFQGLGRQRGRGAFSTLSLCAIGLVLLGSQLWDRLEGIYAAWAVVGMWLSWRLTAAFAESMANRQKAGYSRIR
jgi:tetratricopeptide (TPR) repeat protein